MLANQNGQGNYLCGRRHRAGQVGPDAGRDEGLSLRLCSPVPQGPLYAGITGFDSALYYGTSGIEEEYDSYLGARQRPPQTLSQLIFREKQPTITDDVTLTVEPALQQAAWNALTSTPANNDGAVVVLDPKTGAVLAMVSNPTFDPNALVSTSLSAEQLAYFSYNQKDHEGYFPFVPSPLARRSSPARP